MILRICKKEAAGSAFVARQTARKVSPPTARHGQGAGFYVTSELLELGSSFRQWVKM